MSEVIKLNDREFNFDCVFFNATFEDTNLAVLPVSYGAFEFLRITDNIYSPFLECNFAIDNPLNFIENIPGDAPFRFSANNRNLCKIQLTPLETVDSTDEIRKRNNLGVFGVIDEGAIISSDHNESSVSTFELIDTKLAALLEVKVGYVYPKIITDKTVSENIREILLKIHENADVIDKDFNLGKAGGITIPTNYPFPLSFNLYDAINFLLRFNIATVNNIESQLFLKYDYTNETYKNYSLYDLFNKADQEEVNQETFVIGGKEGPVSTSSIGETSNVPSNNFIKGVVTLKENIIHNVNFSNVNFNVSNQDLIPTYYATTSDPTNVTQLGLVDMKEAMDLFETNVLNTPSMKKLYSESLIKINVNLDESKLGEQNYKVISTNFNADVNEKVAKVQLYNSFMLQNMALSFTVAGQPFRKSGSFIVITRATDMTSGKEFDKKLLGQWLVTQVVHNINRSEYTTHIQCVKPFTVATDSNK